MRSVEEIFDEMFGEGYTARLKNAKNKAEEAAIAFTELARSIESGLLKLKAQQDERNKDANR